jgi:hypothetical protein
MSEGAHRPTSVDAHLFRKGVCRGSAHPTNGFRGRRRRACRVDRPPTDDVRGTPEIDHPLRRMLSRATTTVVAVVALVLSARPVATAASSATGLCKGERFCHKIAAVYVTGDGRPDQLAILTGLFGYVGVRLRVAGSAKTTNEYVKAVRWTGRVYLGAAQIDSRPGKELVLGKTRSGHVQKYYVLAWRLVALTPIQPGSGGPSLGRRPVAGPHHGLHPESRWRHRADHRAGGPAHVRRPLPRRAHTHPGCGGPGAR